MIDNSDPDREAIHEALQASPPEGLEAGSVLTAWVIVSEWMAPSAERSLHKAHSNSLAQWSARGFHHEALFGAWPTGEEDEQ